MTVKQTPTGWAGVDGDRTLARMRRAPTHPSLRVQPEGEDDE
jgi:hypothetical protein